MGPLRQLISALVMGGGYVPVAAKTKTSIGPWSRLCMCRWTTLLGMFVGAGVRSR